MGWILVFLSGCVLAFLFFVLFFRFGLFNGTVLTEVFEESGYYKAEEAAMEERFSECLEEAELPEGILRFADYRDAFQRSLRNQVYGRGGTVPELTALSIAEELTAKLNSMGLEERSLSAEQGILLLSGCLEAGFLETGTVTGAAEWYEAEGRLEPLNLLLDPGPLFGGHARVDAREQRVHLVAQIRVLKGGACLAQRLELVLLGEGGAARKRDGERQGTGDDA